MTESEKSKLCTEYSRLMQNCLSNRAERKMEALEVEAAKNGMKFKLTNKTQYMMPNFIGEPKYELVTT